MLKRPKQPRVRTLAKELGMQIPAKFWRALPENESLPTFERGWLDTKQSARLCQMLKVPGPPPPIIHVFVWGPDIDRLVEMRNMK
jgi:hypothetical protein